MMRSGDDIQLSVKPRRHVVCIFKMWVFRNADIWKSLGQGYFGDGVFRRLAHNATHNSLQAYRT